MAPEIFQILGRICFADGAPAADVTLAIADADPLRDDLIGVGLTGFDGRFRLSFTRAAFNQDALEDEPLPDLYLVCSLPGPDGPVPVHRADFPGRLFAAGPEDLGDISLPLRAGEPLIRRGLTATPQGSKLAQRTDLTGSVLATLQSWAAALAGELLGEVGPLAGAAIQQTADLRAPLLATLGQILGDGPGGLTPDDRDALRHGLDVEGVIALFDPFTKIIHLGPDASRQNLDGLTVALTRELAHFWQFSRYPRLLDEYRALLQDAWREGVLFWRGLPPDEATALASADRLFGFLSGIEGHASYLVTHFASVRYSCATPLTHRSALDALVGGFHRVFSAARARSVHREIARPSLRAFFSLDDRAAQQQAGRASYRARQQGGRPAAFDPALRPPLASFLSLDPPLDPDAARAAAEQGDALAQLTLGRRLLGAPGTQAEALRWLRRAADQGHREARWLLARHSPADEAGSAARWLQQAAEQGLPQAQHDLALRLGGPDAPDPSLFLRWIERAAEQQFIPSQLALGDALAAGRGAPPDPTRALVWYLRAARQQSAEACARLAAFFLSGISVTRDPVRGLHWARLAAEGDAHGHYLLALCLREGWGLDPDGPAALSHLQAAARGGSALARSALADPAPAAWPIADPRANDRLGPIDPPPEADLLRSFAVESRAEGRRQARDLARGPGARYRPVQVIFSFFSALVIALRSVRRNALRASLTILGILIGITAVVVVTALGAGARRSVTASIANLGSNAVMVFPQAANVSGAKGVGARLTEDDGHALLREATSIKAWAPLRRSPVQAVFEGRNAATNAIGSNRSYLEVRAWKLGSGAIWEESSESVKEKVCVIGTTVRDALFGSLDPIGRMIRIGRHSYRVLGVLESKGQAPIGGDQDDIVLMPIGTFNSHVSWAPPGTVNALFLSAASDEVSERAVRQTDEILRQRHHIGAGKEPDFVVRSQAEFQQLQQSIFGALTILLVAVAGVSLLVGGIGVMNIMLVSVAERTREIGIRMAIGARENDILLQFLIEAVVLSILGGIAGISLSFVIVTVLSKAVGFDLGVDLDALLIALGTSTAIGVVFGFFPARRAARLDPIQALGRE